MRGIWFIFVPLIAMTVAVPQPLSTRITGGAQTTIATYPFAAAMQFMFTGNSFSFACGGTILTRSAILSAAECYSGRKHLTIWRARVGSVRHNSGGALHGISEIIMHDSFDDLTLEYNIAILRTETTIVYGSSVQPATIPNSAFTLLEDQDVWAIGWGAIANGGANQLRLRHVQLRILNQDTCAGAYDNLPQSVTLGMVCAGIPIFGGAGQCDGDEGSALIRKVNNDNVVVGVFSWTQYCGVGQFPSVNTLVSTNFYWIISYIY